MFRNDLNVMHVTYSRPILDTKKKWPIVGTVSVVQWRTC